MTEERGKSNEQRLESNGKRANGVLDNPQGGEQKLET